MRAGGAGGRAGGETIHATSPAALHRFHHDFTPTMTVADVLNAASVVSLTNRDPNTESGIATTAAVAGIGNVLPLPSLPYRVENVTPSDEPHTVNVADAVWPDTISMAAAMPSQRADVLDAVLVPTVTLCDLL